MAPRQPPKPWRQRAAAWAPLAVAFWVAVAFFPLKPSDLDSFFWPSAQTALAGHPLMIYEPAGAMVYPNANGPLALLPLTAAGVLVRALGWMEMITLRRAVAFGTFSLFILLMAAEAVAAIERLRGESLSPISRLLAYGGLTVAPPLAQSLAGYGHIEQPLEIWLVLVASRWLAQARPARGGVALGLAVLARTASGLLILPLALVAGSRARRLVALAAATAVTVVLGILPFYLADRADVVHSLLTYRGGLGVGAGSVWTLSRGTALEGIAQHGDLWFVVTAAAALNLWLASRPGGLAGRRLYAALALTSASFALLAKTVWPYYLLETYVLATIWAVGQPRGALRRRLFLLPVFVAGLGLLAEVGVTPKISAGVIRGEGALMFVLLAAVMTWVVTADIAPAVPQQGPPSYGPP